VARGSFKPEKPARNTEKQSVFNSAVNALRPNTFDDSAKDDAWAKKVVQRDWESPTSQTDDPNDDLAL
jgi:hypothetical protein